MRDLRRDRDDSRDEEDQRKGYCDLFDDRVTSSGGVHAARTDGEPP